jgi:ubiquinone/menaquinone biosynthesis C-methylase UbiE
MSLVPARRNDPEILDRSDNSAADLESALHDVRRVNRWLGGRRALLAALEPHLRAAATDRPMTLLDLGTGSADLPLDILRHARRLGRELWITAVDRDAEIARIAARAVRGEPEIRVVRADATRLPFAPGSFDLVTASMFLHHFHDAELVELLAACRRVARRAVVVNDLRRHRLPWVTIRFLGAVLRRHPMFRHDAPLSVLRGFTVDELERAAVAAGETRPAVRRAWPFRLLLTLTAEQWA